MTTNRSDVNKLTVAVVCSAFGTELTHLAVPLFAIKVLNATPFDMGILTAIGTLPNILFGLLVGGLISNESVKNILVRMDVARALLLLFLAIATYLGHANIVILYGVVFLTGVAALFFDVSYYSFVPLLVGRDDLVSANSRIETGRTASSLFGNAVAGGLILLIGFSSAFLIDALTFLISAVAIYLISWRAVPDPIGSSESRNDKPSLRAQIWRGFSFVGSNKMVLALTVSGAIFNFFTAMEMALVSYFFVNTLNLSVTLIAIAFTFASIGAVLGAYLSEYSQRIIGFGGTIIIGFLMNAASSLIVALTYGEHAMLIVSTAFLVGAIGGTQASIVQLSLRQAVVPKEISTTVNAAVRFILWGVLPIGGLLGGLVASAVGVRITLILAAFGLVGAALVPLFSPVRRLKVLPTPAA